MFVGIDNDGNAVASDCADEDYTQITMLVKYTIQENRVISIAVGEGNNKP